MRVKYVKYSRRFQQEQAEVSVEVEEDMGDTPQAALTRARDIVNEHLGIGKALSATIGERVAGKIPGGVARPEVRT